MSDTSQQSVEAATALIGTRLADLRRAAGLRPSELARRAGVSPSLVSQVERGRSRPSVGTLFAIARVLGVPVDAFFAAPGEEAHAPPVTAAPVSRAAGSAALAALAAGAWPTGAAHDVVVRRGERAAIDIRGGVRWERLTPTAVDGIEFLELVYAAGAESDSQLYRHPGVELVLVTAGVMTIFLGFEQHDLQPGDSTAFPSTTPHRYVNLTGGETRAITMIVRDDLSGFGVREGPPPAAA